ncbi:UDP-N-acetylmuramate--L-alanine ligase [Arachidicoccus soli]|uniref:Peptidoglycan synthetase n=1 Tax=Arachidicoccus soli TaxID=2341117 RepID=A0A386HU21_9BACT|nr:Mur ligase family protein [Arachidicoccus soli]AYD49001.1 peptidoglycan synthetase [Arachidicoccus soli]
MHIHFISIGGSVMHQLAIALHKKGYIVSGSDDEIFEPAKSNLQSENLLPKDIGWHPENINKNIDAVILGMHAKADNPELLKAKELGLKIYSFPEYIYQESKNKKRVAIGGSHGKTSTTAMLMHVLQQTKTSFDYLVGAKLEGFSQSVNITDAPIIVCEADEYPASTLEPRPKFHFLFPHIAVLTGIAWDHINVFPTFDFYLEQFKIFIQKIEKGGILIYNETDSILKDLIEENKRSDIRYQPYHLPDHQIENGETIIEIESNSATISVFGNHNLLNLNAAYFVCKELGISAKDFVQGIQSFSGASKRLEVIFSNENTTVYRDFAHAPSKVRATVDAVKQQFPDRQLVAVLELHTFSSLNENFLHQYKGSLELADVAVVFYSPHALELKRMPLLPKTSVLNGFAKDNLFVINNKEDLSSFLQTIHLQNCNLLLMSSGSFDGIDILSTIKG